MKRFICKLLTKGEHRFRLKQYRYRCQYCGQLRMSLLKDTKQAIIQKFNIPPSVVGDIEDCKTVNCKLESEVKE